MGERAAGLGVEQILALLAGGAHTRLTPGTALSQLDHALQTAVRLRRERPDDLDLAVAGLVHDIGHLLPGVGDAAHADAGAAAVRATLGDRVAGIVALHVEAKRYLVATEPGYGGELAADSVASLGTQGGPMAVAEVATFEALSLAPAAVALRRADEGAKVEGAQVGELAHWGPLLWWLSGREA